MDSYTNCITDSDATSEVSHDAHVLVIYTGGTIGMKKNNDNVYEPVVNQFVQSLRHYPNFHDTAYAQKTFGICGNEAGPLVLPEVFGFGRRVIYSILEYNPLLDSSNMQMFDYTKIAMDIERYYTDFDGFVIVHGTDTLSYTASALSFMLDNLTKTVIITGSQIPIFESRTDAVDNFLSSLLIAGNIVIPEVCVYFGSCLLRGNRTIKKSVDAFNAFESPNYGYLAISEVNIEVYYNRFFNPNKMEPFKVYLNLNSNVGVLRLFPSITSTQVRAFCQPPIVGVVLHTFGAGSIPTNREDIIEALKEATANGIIIVNCTQCLNGSVNMMHESSQLLKDCGVISGNDMTPEAALAKLSHLLAREDLQHEDVKKMMLYNLRGELTPYKPSELQDYDLVEAIARTLQIELPNYDPHLGNILFQSMIHKAIIDSDLDKLNILKKYGVDMSATDPQGRTALHIACAEGNIDIVNFLLLEGVSTNTHDYRNITPLMEAISNDNFEIIKSLMKHDACLTFTGQNLGEHLCAAAVRGLTNRLESYRLSGACLSQSDPVGRTALHVAAETAQYETVQYLLQNDADRKLVDELGFRPIDYATKHDNTTIVKLLGEQSVGLPCIPI